MNLDSREYKLLVDHRLFVEPEAGLAELWQDFEAGCTTVPHVHTRGAFDEKEKRTIVFLDTPDHTLRRHGLVLRQRRDDVSVEYTLKCRSEDHYFASGADVRPAPPFKVTPKFEEDIARPFSPRFSRSTTITLEEEQSAQQKTPRTLREAGVFFPLLTSLRVDGRMAAVETVLVPVNNITIHEVVWKGPKILFKGEEQEPIKANVALILWAHRDEGRPTIAELSFRIKDGDVRFGRSLANAARSVYTMMQRLDGAETRGITKTEYIYRDGAKD